MKKNFVIAVSFNIQQFVSFLFFIFLGGTMQDSEVLTGPGWSAGYNYPNQKDLNSHVGIGITSVGVGRYAYKALAHAGSPGVVW